MNREEILAMSRQENKNMDLVDKAVEDRSKTIAGMVMVSMCLLYHLVEMVVLNRKNYGFFKALWRLRKDSRYNGTNIYVNMRSLYNTVCYL